MKKLLTLLVCILALSLNAQDIPEDSFLLSFGFSIDPKMAIEGPHDLGSTYNAEYSIGVEKENIRFSMAFEQHEAIGYRKWTWIKVDHIFREVIFDNISVYTGLEASVIYRKFDGDYESDSLPTNPGANVEVQYHIPRTPLSVAAGINVFRAEAILIETGKQIRYDGMLSLYLKL